MNHEFVFHYVGYFLNNIWTRTLVAKALYFVMHIIIKQDFIGIIF